MLIDGMTPGLDIVIDDVIATRVILKLINTKD